MNAYLVISLLFFFFHSPTENFFLVPYCKPSRICHEEFVACYLTPEQRTEYDQMISDNEGNLNQSLVDSLNLIIDHLMSNTCGFSSDSINETDDKSFIQKSGKMFNFARIY